MDQTTRNHLQRATQDARRVLEAEFAAQLEGTFDILPDGRILPEPGKHLDDRQRLIRGQIVAAIEHIRDKEAGKTKAQAIDDYRREAAFTFLNRFAALKMLEARGLVQQCVSKGDQSGGFKEFTGLAPGLSELPDKGYQLYLECLFDELGTEVNILFDRRDPASLLWPRRQALLDLLDILNRPELGDVWAEDEAIGWVYQYFNGQEERRAMRDASAAPRNSRELAVRNQFFTPRYVVEFLTDNTLGRIWYEMRQGRTSLKEQCRYMVRKPDEVFLAASTAAGQTGSEGCVRMAHELTAAPEADFPPFSAEDGDQIQRMIELAHSVSAYEQLGDKLSAWLQSARGSIEAGRFDGHTTGEILNYLFFTCRSDRHGGDGSVYREPWFAEAANEVRRRFLAGRGEGLTQAELLKAPVAIPYRPRKDPRDLKILDPACGSGHFLLYCFDLLNTIYPEAWGDESSPNSEATGKTLREDYPSLEALRPAIPGLILRHNLHGIDIDPRCAQIAALALWMRAQRVFNDFSISRDQRPAIRRTNIVVAEPMPGEREMLDGFLRSLREDRLESLIRQALDNHAEQRVRATKAMAESLCELVERVWVTMSLAGEAGSLLMIEEELASAIEKGRDEWEEKLPLFRVTEYSFDGRGKETYYRHLPGIGQDFWDKAESLTLRAIEEYAAAPLNGGRFRRRMFAEDATRGFAFIDLCRKRYDVVLMNPPFGAGSLAAKKAFDMSYPRTKNDLFAAFVDRGVRLLHKRGRLGAITSRAGFFLSTFQQWREEILLKEARPAVFADLGSGVLDSAMVEVAAYCLEAAG